MVTIRMEDASRLKAPHVRVLHRPGPPPWRGDPREAAGTAFGPAELCAGRVARLRAAEERARPVEIRVAYTAGEAIGADLFAFFRSLGINLKQL